MKKKIFVSTILILFALLTATTAFAASYYADIAQGGTQYPTSSLYFGSRMRAKDNNYETYHYLDGEKTPCPHKSCLVQGTAVRSAELTIQSETYKYIYPDVAADLRLRIKNPYNQFQITARGMFSNLYY